MNVIVARIYELMSKSGISKVSLADKIGVSRNTIQNWQKENSFPTIYVIERICEAFNITVEQFFSGMGTVDKKSEQEFLDYWRTMGDNEKASIQKVIETFKELRKVQND